MATFSEKTDYRSPASGMGAAAWLYISALRKQAVYGWQTACLRCINGAFMSGKRPLYATETSTTLTLHPKLAIQSLDNEES